MYEITLKLRFEIDETTLPNFFKEAEMEPTSDFIPAVVKRMADDPISVITAVESTLYETLERSFKVEKL